MGKDIRALHLGPWMCRVNGPSKRPRNLDQVWLPQKGAYLYLEDIRELLDSGRTRQARHAPAWSDAEGEEADAASKDLGPTGSPISFLIQTPL